jgi:5-methylcytosine-specific restriction enzyme subunit McrC
VPNADVYQALAYAIATELPGATLIYAKGETGSFHHQISQVGKSIDVTELDIEATPEDLLDQIGHIGSAILAQVPQPLVA